MNNRKNFIAAVSVAFVLLVFLILYISLRSHRSECEPYSDASNIQPSQVRNVPSKDLMALASFAGYLTYPADPLSGRVVPTYLNLGLNSVHWFSTYDQLMLKTNCATISLFLGVGDPNSKPRRHQVFKTAVTLNTPNQGEYTCTSTRNTGIEFDEGKHYTCSTPFKISCSAADSGKKLVELNILELSFEVGGQPAMVASGIYSTPGDICSQ